MRNELSANLDKLHSTELGIERIKRNLNLDVEDVASWCRQKIKNADRIVKKGKNWYVYAEHTVFTVNAHSFTIITAHREKIKEGGKD